MLKKHKKQETNKVFLLLIKHKINKKTRRRDVAEMGTFTYLFIFCLTK